MGLFKKLKDVLFDEEEYTEQIKITPEMRNEAAPIKEKKHKVVEEVKEAEEPIRVLKEDVPPVREKEEEPKKEPTSDRDVFKTTANFPFFDFDEEEFAKQNTPVRPREERRPEMPSRSNNAFEYERKKMHEKRTDYGHYEKIERTEVIERKKFKPSPIISPVYGILDRDYDPSDIVHRNENTKPDLQTVRNKAFGDTKEIPKVKEEEPKKVYYEEEDTVTITRPDEKEKKVKTIDELLEETSNDIVDIDRDLVIPEVMEDLPRREKIKAQVEEKKPEKKQEADVEDTLENDLFDLIDSMYDRKEGGEE